MSKIVLAILILCTLAMTVTPQSSPKKFSLDTPLKRSLENSPYYVSVPKEGLALGSMQLGEATTGLNFTFIRFRSCKRLTGRTSSCGFSIAVFLSWNEEPNVNVTAETCTNCFRVTKAAPELIETSTLKSIHHGFVSTSVIVTGPAFPKIPESMKFNTLFALVANNNDKTDQTVSYLSDVEDVTMTTGLGLIIAQLALVFCLFVYSFGCRARNYKLMGSVDKFSQSIGNRVRKVIKSSEEETSKPKKATVDLEEVTIEEAENKAENVQTGFIILEAIVELIVAWLRTLFTTALLFSSFSTVLPNISIEALQLEFNITFPALGDFLVGVLSILNSLNLYDAFEFTCLESTSALMPLVTMIGFVLLRVLFEADILLGIIMLLKSIKKRFVDSALPLRLLMNFFCGIGAGVMVYILQVILVSIGSIVRFHFALGFSGFCNQTTYATWLMSWILGSFVVVAFLLGNLKYFAGEGSRIPGALSDDDIRRDGDVCVRAVCLGANRFTSAITAFPRLIKITFGFWDQETVEAFNIKERALMFDDDETDDDNQQESVMSAAAKTSGMLWVMFPYVIVLAKAAEQLNNPPAWIDSTDVELITSEDRRKLSYAANFLNLLAIVIFMFSLSSTWLVVALIAPALEKMADAYLQLNENSGGDDEQ